MLNPKRLQKEFETLVRFDCESYHEKEIGKYLVKKFQDLGLEVTVDDAPTKLAEKNHVDTSESHGNIYAFLKGNSNTKEPLFLNGHMDTVKPGIHKVPVIHEDGLITSDGTTVLGADDAAAVAEMIELLTIIQEDNLEHGDIEIIVACCEEPFCQGASVFDYSLIQSKTGYTLDLAGKIGSAAISAPTILSFTITVHGKSAHAGFAPEEGIHALKVSANAIHEIQMGHIDDNTVVNIGTIQGGVQRNSVPDCVVMTGEIRSLINERAYEEWDTIKEILEKCSNELGATVDFEYREEVKAYSIQEDSPVVKRYMDACNKCGIDVTLSSTFGGSDNHHYSNHSIEGIVIANAMNACHTTSEYTSIQDMTSVVNILIEML